MNEQSKWDEFRRKSEEFQRQRIERLRKTNDLLPPWLLLTNQPRTSGAWRMGSGEDYLADWYLWIQGLSADRRIAYKAQYTEPRGWEGTYDIIPTVEAKANEKSWDKYWDETFERQKKIIDAQVRIGQQHEKK